MKRIEDFSASELATVYMKTGNTMSDVLDYIKANMSTEPMSAEEIGKVVEPFWTQGWTFDQLCKLIQPLTVQQGFVVTDEMWKKAPEWATGVAPYWVVGHELAISKLHVELVEGAYIPRPTSKMRKRTRDEKISKLLDWKNGRLEGLGIITALQDATIDDLCLAAGIDLEVQE